jgi:hypothetical protein
MTPVDKGFSPHQQMRTLLLLLLVLLEGSHEGDLVLVGLEATVPELAGSVDEFERDLLQGALLGVNQQGLPEY